MNIFNVSKQRSFHIFEDRSISASNIEYHELKMVQNRIFIFKIN